LDFTHFNILWDKNNSTHGNIESLPSSGLRFVIYDINAVFMDLRNHGVINFQRFIPLDENYLADGDFSAEII